MRNHINKTKLTVKQAPQINSGESALFVETSNSNINSFEINKNQFFLIETSELLNDSFLLSNPNSIIKNEVQVIRDSIIL